MKMLTEREILSELVDIYTFERDFLLEKMDDDYSSDDDLFDLQSDLDRVDDYIDFLERLLFQYSKTAGEGKALS